MQVNKKVFATAITALLLLSILAVAVPAYAIGAPILSATSVNVGTKVTVSGVAGDASAGGLVQVFWENQGGPLLNSTYALGTGAYELIVVIPDAVQGLHSIIVKDVSTGTTAGATVTINPKITRDPTSGIPGDSVTVTGSGFAAVKNITITFSNATYTKDVTAALMNSTATGNFSAAIIVPVVAYGDYTITATDANSNTANVAFTVGASVSITPKSGPTGSVVAITGRGFVHVAATNITITVGGITAKQVAQIQTAADGTFTGSFIIPTLPVGTATVSVTDGTFTAATSFKVTGTTAIQVVPTSGQPGAAINILGYNFTAIAGTSVTVLFATLPVATLATDATGFVNGTFVVPSLPTAGYTITATDAKSLTASTTFTIAITYLSVAPTSGAAGTLVTLTGYGFTTGSTVNVTMASKLMKINIPVAELVAGTTFLVPTLAVGTYTITAVDSAGLTASTTYQVTKTTELILNPSTSPSGTTVNLAANGFSGVAGTTITFILKNSTYSQALTVAAATGFSGTSTNATGNYKGTFTVPAIALGAYIVNATDSNGLTVEVAFTIGAATLQINTRATSYSQGDIVSFTIQATFSADMIIKVADPTGYPALLYIFATDFTPMGSLQVVPYWGSGGVWAGWIGTIAALRLPSDAVVGTWTWNTTVSGETRSGTFTVKAGSSALLSAINSTVSGLAGTLVSIQGDTATIRTSTGTITASLSSIQGTVTQIQGSIATLNIPDIGSITTSLTSISAKIDSVSGDVATLSTSLGPVTTSLSALSPKLDTISGNVVAIQTSVGTLQGTITSISGNIATVQTDVGTLKTEVTNTNNSVNGIPALVYIAIVLALVAAIAAIASIILVRQKIAG